MTGCKVKECPLEAKMIYFLGEKEISVCPNHWSDLYVREIMVAERDKRKNGLTQ